MYLWKSICKVSQSQMTFLILSGKRGFERKVKVILYCLSRVWLFCCCWERLFMTIHGCSDRPFWSLRWCGILSTPYTWYFSNPLFIVLNSSVWSQASLSMFHFKPLVIWILNFHLFLGCETGLFSVSVCNSWLHAHVVCSCVAVLYFGFSFVYEMDHFSEKILSKHLSWFLVWEKFMETFL